MTISTQRLRLLRGNSAAAGAFTGLQGELVFDTTLYTLRLQDGVTPGGYLLATATDLANVAANASYGNSNVGSYLTTYSGNLSAGNILSNNYLYANGVSILTGIQSNYGNSNVASYLTTYTGNLTAGNIVSGNILPSANVTYSLGSSSRQWRDLWLSNNTMYLGGFPITITANGTLQVNGSPVSGTGNYSDSNVVSLLSSFGSNTIVTTGNVTVGNLRTATTTIALGYHAGSSGQGALTVAVGNQAGEIDQGLQATAVGSGAGNYAQGIGTTAVGTNAGAVNQGLRAVAIGALAGSQNQGAYAVAVGNFAGGNDQANNSIILSATGTNWTASTSGFFVAPVAANTAGNVLYYNTTTNEITYGAASATYSNANVASYLPTYTGNIAANIVKNGYTWTFGNNGSLVFPSAGDIQGSDSIYSSISLASLYSTFAGSENVQIYANNSGTTQQWLFDTDGILTLPSGGQIGALQPGAGVGIDLFASNTMSYAQVNYDNKNYIYVDPGVSQLQTPNVNIIAGTTAKSAIIQVADPDYSLDNSWTFYPNGTADIPGTLRYGADKSSRFELSHDGFRLDSNTTGGGGSYIDGQIGVLFLLGGDGGTVLGAAGNTWDFLPNGNIRLPANNSVITYFSGENILRNINGNSITANVGTFGTIYGTLGTASQTGITTLGTLTGLAVSGTTNTTTLQVSGNATIGNLLVTGNSTIIGNITQISGNSGQFFGNAATGFNALYTGIAAGYTPLQHTIIQSSGNFNDYVQINLENINSGNAATADYIVTADNGTDATYYIDMGIASSNFDGLSPNIVGNSVRANDAYLYTLGNGAGNQGGNLIIGTGTASKVVKIIAGGGHDHDVVATVAAGSFTVNGNVTGTYFIGNGALLTGIAASSTYSNANVASYLPTYSGNISVGNLTLASNASNVVFTNGATIYGDTGGLNRNGSIVLQPAASGTFPSVIVGGAGRLAAPNGSVHQIFNTNDVTFQVAVKNSTGLAATSTTSGALQITGGAGLTGNVYAGGAVVATGNVTGNFFIGNGALLTGITASANYGNTNVTAFLGAYGSNTVVTTGNITAGYFVGNGALLTGIVANTTYSNTNVASYLTGNIVVGNVSGSQPNVTLVANTYSYVFDNVGNITIPGNINYANGINILSGLGSGSGNYSNSNVASYLPVYTGNVNAAYYFGNGSQLTGITATTATTATYVTGLTSSNVTTALGYVPLNSNGTAVTATTATYVTGLTDANITTALGYTPTNYSNSNVASYLSSSSVNTLNAQSATFRNGDANPNYASTQITFGYNNTSQYPHFVHTRHNAGSGLYNSIELYTSDGTQSGVFPTNGILGLSVSNGKVGIGNNANPTYTLDVAGNAYVSGNATAAYFIGNGALLTGITATANYGNANVASYLTTYGGPVNANVITGTANATVNGLAVNNTATIGSTLGVTGNINGSGITLTGSLRATGTGDFDGGLQSTPIGNVAGMASTGSFTTITANANVTASALAVNNTATIGSTLGVTGNVTVAANVTVTANVVAGNIITTGSGGNISGVNIVYGNLVGSGNTTVQDFTVNGNSTIGGNLTISGLYAGYAPARAAVRVYGNTSTNWTANTTISNQVIDYNQGSYYSNSTGLFTVPIPGLYHCYATVRVGNNNALNQAALLKNNTLSGANVIAFWETDTNAGVSSHFSITGYAKCVAGDTISLKVIAGNVQFDTNDSWGVTYIG